MARSERASPPDEKVTVNVGPVDLGRIDLLVEEGFFASRTDFIRDAIRRLLDEHKAALEEATTRREVSIGFVRLSARYLEEVKSKNERLDIKVLGAFQLADDVPPELADAVIDRISVLGSLRAPKSVLERLGDKVARGRNRT